MMLISLLQLLFCTLAYSSAAEVSSSSWRCANNKNTTAIATTITEECSCRTVNIEGFTGTNLDCSWRNFTSFAANITLPLLIHKLDLSYNKITVLGKSPFQHWNPLKELILSHNEMVSIIDNPFSGLDHLRKLDLSHNLLTVLPSTLLPANRRSIRIDLSYNNINGLPIGIFNSTRRVESISLNHNLQIGEYINESPESIQQALRNGLKSLEMNSVNLSKIPPNFFNGAVGLERLSLSENHFTRVPSFFIGGLQVLNLSGCAFEVIETGSFIELPSLQELYLDRNVNLTDVEEEAFDGLDYLRTLSIENCVQLQTFHGLALGPLGPKGKYLKKVSLANSGLQTLSLELQEIFSQVENVQLHGNPWHCDCNLAWMLDVKFSSREKKKLRCFSPPYLRDDRIFSLTKDQMLCPRPVSRVRSGLIITMAVLLGVLCMAVIVAFLDFLRRTRWQQTRRIGRYQPIEVQLEANQAEYDSEEKETVSQPGISFIRSNAMP